MLTRSTKMDDDLASRYRKQRSRHIRIRKRLMFIPLSTRKASSSQTTFAPVTVRTASGKKFALPLPLFDQEFKDDNLTSVADSISSDTSEPNDFVGKMLGLRLVDSQSLLSVRSVGLS